MTKKEFVYMCEHFEACGEGLHWLRNQPGSMPQIWARMPPWYQSWVLTILCCVSHDYELFWGPKDWPKNWAPKSRKIAKKYPWKKVAKWLEDGGCDDEPTAENRSSNKSKELKR